MEDSQREAMYNGWKNSKTWLKVKTSRTVDGVTVSTLHEGTYYKQEFRYDDCIGSADPFSIAYSRLQSELKQIDKNIELVYPL